MSILNKTCVEPKQYKATGKKKVVGKRKATRIGTKTQMSGKTTLLGMAKQATCTERVVSNVIPGFCPPNNMPHILIRHGGPQAWNPCRLHKLSD